MVINFLIRNSNSDLVEVDLNQFNPSVFEIQDLSYLSALIHFIFEDELAVSHV
jgi:hypothetical protein